MAKAKEWSRADTIKSLTVAHDNCTAPDQVVFDANQLNEMTDDQLKSLRESTKRKRPPRAAGTTPTTRKTFGQTGIAHIKIAVELDEDQRKALAILGHTTETKVSNYLSTFTSSSSRKGPGAVSWIPEEDRPAGSVVINCNKVVASGVDSVAQAAKQEERFNKALQIHGLVLNNRDLRLQTNESLPDDQQLPIESDEEIDNIMRAFMKNAEYSDDQITDIMDRLAAQG